MLACEDDPAQPMPTLLKEKNLFVEGRETSAMEA